MVTVPRPEAWSRREHFERVPAVPFDRYVVGVDLGQSTDPTAICVLHAHARGLDTWTPTKSNTNVLMQDSETRFDVRYLERLPLGTSYPECVAHVSNLLTRPPLSDSAELVIDETGVGRAVGDIFDSSGLAPIRVTITAGNESTQHAPHRWHVPKALLISAVDARLHTGELRFAANLREAGALADELKDFRRKVTDAGRSTYSARTGAHDDLVLAVAIALWRAVQPRNRVSVGHVHGLT